MRITVLHVSGTGTLAGGFRVITQYARALAQAGHTVTLVSPPRPRRRRFGGRIGRRLPLYEAALVQDDYLRDAPFENRVLTERRPIRDEDVPDADLVVASWWQAAVWMNALSPQKGSHIHFVQDFEPLGTQTDAEFARVHGFDNTKIAVAGGVGELLRETFGARRVRVVGNGVDTSWCQPDAGSTERGSKIGMIYRTTPSKGADLAAVALRQAGGVQGLSFGPDPLAPEHANAFCHHVMAPDQADIPALYASCRAWLLPSAHEGFGLPILEAMACGTPVISTRVGAAPDLIDGTNGLLVDHNADAFASAIVRLRDMPEQAWLQMSRAARRTAEANSLDAAASRFEQALQDVSAGRL